MTKHTVKMEATEQKNVDSKHTKSHTRAAVEQMDDHIGSDAARAVFNTPELLEQILKQLPMSFLGRALSISKYCQNVILGSAEMRRTLFFEPALAIIHITQARIWMLYMGFPPQFANVQAHPFLTSLGQPLKTLQLSDRDKMRASHKIPFTTLKKAPALALLFQPPPPEVRLFYIHHAVLRPRYGGVTFGAILDELCRQRQECQNLHRPCQKCQKIIDDVATRSWTPTTRAEVRRVVKALKHLHGVASEQHRLDDLCVFLSFEPWERNGVHFGDVWGL